MKHTLEVAVPFILILLEHHAYNTTIQNIVSTAYVGCNIDLLKLHEFFLKKERHKHCRSCYPVCTLCWHDRGTSKFYHIFTIRAPHRSSWLTSRDIMQRLSEGVMEIVWDNRKWSLILFSTKTAPLDRLCVTYRSSPDFCSDLYFRFSKQIFGVWTHPPPRISPAPMFPEGDRKSFTVLQPPVRDFLYYGMILS